MAALVALRLCLGCHFLYEGVWKIKHGDEFTAEPFLSQAKGPISGFFYAMVPDQYGRQRLALGEIKDEKTGKMVECVDCEPVAVRWNEIRQNLLAHLNPGPPAGAEARKDFDQFKSDSKEVLEKSQASLQAYFAEKELVEAVKAYFQSLDRFEKDPEKSQDAPFQEERRWNRMMELRGEAKVWIDELQDRERAFINALREKMPEEYQAQVTTLPGGWKPWKWSQMQFINFAVTYGLTAIGLCLMAGLFTRLAALGGAAFMCFVVMTQPAWPSIYPPDLPQLGHALLINKDFLEMVALVVVASSAVGRWGGLDHFVHRLIVEPWMKSRQ
ncbi:MAG: DoxX family protein [Pirellulales bacterium]|nr:DoxX family protein [Pirellulales bacterium]